MQKLRIYLLLCPHIAVMVMMTQLWHQWKPFKHNYKLLLAKNLQTIDDLLEMFPYRWQEPWHLQQSLHCTRKLWCHPQTWNKKKCEAGLWINHMLVNKQSVQIKKAFFVCICQGRFWDIFRYNICEMAK